MRKKLTNIAMSNVYDFVLPDLKKVCPWQVKTNPHFASAYAESSAWIDKFGFFRDAKRQHFIRSSTELLASYVYPYTGPDELLVCCDAMNLFWTIDEMLDDYKYPSVCDAADVYVRAIKGGSTEDSSIVRMVVDWKERLDLKIKPRTEKRFVKAYCGYLESIINEKKHLECEGLTLQEYEAHRRKNSGTDPFFVLIEYAQGIELPDALFENETFMKIYWAAVDMIGYSNDLYSYFRERDIGLEENNLLTVLMREKNMTLQQAAYQCGEIFKGLVNTFEESKALLPSFAALVENRADGSAHDIDHDVAIFIQSMETWVVGNLYWSFATQRYFGPEHNKVEQTLVVQLKETVEN